MKKFFFYSAIYSILLSQLSCGTPKVNNKTLIYQNIVILSDMSSRIHHPQFAQKDTTKIQELCDYFKNECVKPGQKTGDKSSIYFSLFTGDVTLDIDLGKYKTLLEKQQFINSTGEYKNNGLNEELQAFNDSIKATYNQIENPGLDLISLLIEKIENESFIKQNEDKDKAKVSGLDTTFIQYDNHLYIFTDGYLEYGNKKDNDQYYFGRYEIEKIRQYAIKNNISIEKSLIQDNQLGLDTTRCNIRKNKSIHLHIWETHERDKDIQKGTYKHRKGFRDNEILEAVWRKWATDCGFKSFEWKKY